MIKQAKFNCKSLAKLVSGMRKLFILFFTSLITTSTNAQHTLQKLWESDSILAVPESVLLYNHILFVSLVDGQALDADGKGGIAQLDENGNIINTSWLTGLNAPKGMVIWKDKLYVTDISRVVIVDVTDAKIDSVIYIDGAKGLNDITVNDHGVIYVSDSETGKVYLIKDGMPKLYLQGLSGANGLTTIGKNIFCLQKLVL